MALDIESFILGQQSAGGGGGGDVEVKSMTATANGTYRAPTGKAYSPVVVALPIYTGGYEAESAPFQDTVLPTQGKVMEHDLTVKQIPVAEVSNTAGGYTVTIGR